MSEGVAAEGAGGPSFLDSSVGEAGGGIEIGTSREGRPIVGYRFGTGSQRISLIGGCHADEPVGPRLLGRLAGYLSHADPADPLLGEREWWVVPHANPDGRAKNFVWQGDGGVEYGLAPYLLHSVREQPGDDMEFGFPRGPEDRGARPETRAIEQWWRSADGPFALHCSLHGMGFAAGPWFLIEPTWIERTAPLRRAVTSAVAALGYRLHDVAREGEKGFVRIARGFCTRPDSRAMRDYFLMRGDPETARLFRPSTMETIRSFGGDPLTLVTEMPLFILPGVGKEIGPPDRVALEWSDRIQGWRARLENGEDPAEIRGEATALGMMPMPVADQMALQWAFIASGVSLARSPGAD